MNIMKNKEEKIRFYGYASNERLHQMKITGNSKKGDENKKVF